MIHREWWELCASEAHWELTSKKIIPVNTMCPPCAQLIHNSHINEVSSMCSPCVQWVHCKKILYALPMDSQGTWIAHYDVPSSNMIKTLIMDLSCFHCASSEHIGVKFWMCLWWGTWAHYNVITPDMMTTLIAPLVCFSQCAYWVHCKKIKSGLAM